MSDLEWDAEDYTPPPPANAVSDKWDGEDEEFSIKESWDDEEEDKKDESTSSDVGKPKKKKIQDIIAEKEKRKQEEMERRRKEREEERKNLSPEEQIVEKLRLQKIQEESDLNLASDMFGDKDKDQTEATPLDGFDLSSKDELEDFRRALVDKVRNTDRLEKRPFYVSFVEDLSRDLCQNMEMEDVKRVTSVLNAVYNEKVKANKPSKGKKKGASKAKLNPGQGAIADNINADFDYGEYDDFI